MVRAHQDGIFQAAHPLSDTHDPPNVSITESNEDNATIVESVNWKGASGRNFRTVLQFMISYDGDGTVTLVDMKATDYGNPSFAAFSGLNITKWLALSYVTGNLINEGRYLSGGLAKIISSAITIENVVTAWLKYAMNNPSGD